MAPEKIAPAEWGDIPDPLVGAPPSSGRPPAAPSEFSPTRRQVKRRRAAVLVVCAAWCAGALSVIGLRRELSLNARFVAAQTLLWLGLLVFAMAAAGNGKRGLGARAAWVRGLSLGAPLAFMAVALVWTPPGSGARLGETGPIEQLIGCFVTGVLLASPIVALALWSVRRAFPSGAAWRGALLGTAAGLAAAIVLTLHCDNPFGGHVALAHGLPIAIATLVAAWLGTRVARA
jgi:hypothetical protein